MRGIKVVWSLKDQVVCKVRGMGAAVCHHHIMGGVVEGTSCGSRLFPRGVGVKHHIIFPYAAGRVLNCHSHYLDQVVLAKQQ